jgi:hypothetical protein
MKPSEQCLNEARRQRTEAIVTRHVYELFQRLPMLCGTKAEARYGERRIPCVFR